MNIHVKVVAVLHIVFGALGLIAACVVFAVFGTAGGIVIWQGEQEAATIIGIVASAICFLIFILSIPGIIAGAGLLAGKGWARVLMIVLGILDLLNFPLGTALGVYTLWALLRNEQQFATL